ncbi:AraC family transcriptional regulator [Stenotrophomonas sp. SrG]|uniref:AraC family transcriptional regulator n=1 Tax=Stenotrophomonas sp. SrG TaxID=3414430 RepID=UPI003CE90B68
MLTRLHDAVESLLSRSAGEGDRVLSPLPGVIVSTTHRARMPTHALYRPALGVVVQGAKQVLAGRRSLDYRAGQGLVTGIAMPASGRVLAASRAQPFMGVSIELDTGVLQQVLAGLDPGPSALAAASGLSVHTLPAPLLDCVARIVEAVRIDDAAAVLVPTLLRELSYWLLTGPTGPEVAAMARPEGTLHRIAEAVVHLRRHFRQPLQVESLAAASNMSVSLFYRRFRAVTGISPLQFQKQLRLLEARRLLETQAVNVTTAALAVGYESLSQFSREYQRCFGHTARESLQRSTPSVD